MYKRTIQTLKGKKEEDQSDFTIKRLENLVASTDQDINLFIRKVQALKNIKKGQDQGIEKDINEDLKRGVVTMKKELEATKKVLKEAAKRERLREVNYKRQQAYLFEV